ncbi:MAG: hypothetical protein M3X11_06995 [Acidobacteriota bacterium]|nr:hypothetical protein [Acidobacteriota bacterium]
MAIKRRIKISATRIRRQRVTAPGIRVFCLHCAQEVETWTASQAAEVLEVSAAALQHFIAEGQVHAIATVSGSLRICRVSLFPQSPAITIGDKR